MYDCKTQDFINVCTYSFFNIIIIETFLIQYPTRVLAIYSKIDLQVPFNCVNLIK